ncbi:DUF433 domain-containing protein [Planktothricoides raciborskii]|uniref:DUF433 domain-containing protein n=2 Tax=Planktothricoides raciborskii TaxID=132608 RepID=A0AAU8JFV1_9CYAN|nr:DUF433 domain-containing protein [Planktothricoides raciborskii]MBD2546161.1 DUF433 domain-containing protein [Planktothricoides raciborskii FACHB-1370]MBD2583841.1 DUF433 domain-containing protein [Planktothricoides raciborskii FACHB-1261]
MPQPAIITEHIEITPGVLGGKPRIAGHRIAVAHIAEMYLKMGISLEEIAGKYDLSLASVHAAMTYYYDHRAEIDRHTAESRMRVEELKRNSPPSPLQEKLRAIRGE